MKYLALLFAILINSLSSYSLADEQNVSYEFYVDEHYYTLCDSVNLREEANISSKSLTQLPIGSKLLILEKTEQLTNLNGIDFFWYKVQTEKKTIGYVWGGKIALQSFRSTKNTDFVFHYGVEKIVDDVIFFQIRVEKNHKELQRVSIEGFGGPYKNHQLGVFANMGLKNVDDIFTFQGFAEACGENAGIEYIFWSNEKLYKVKRVSHFYDAPFFYHEALIFPSDMEGTKDKIIYTVESGEHVDDTENPQNDKIEYEKNEKSFLVWTGKELKVTGKK